MKLDKVVKMATTTKLQSKFYQKIQFTILVYVFLSYLLSWKMFEFPKSLFAQKVFETDGIFTQTQIQTLVSGPLFFKNDHLGYPFGFSQWSSPQFSFTDQIFFKILGKLFNFSNYGYISILGFIIILINSLTFFWLAKAYEFSISTQYFFGLLAAVNPYVLNSIMHPHVMKIFIIPVFLILIKYFSFHKAISKKEKILIFFILISSSLYWVNVFFAIFLISTFTLVLLKLFGYLKDKKIITISLKLFFITSLTLFFNSIFYLMNKDITGENGRETWHSDLFSGKFTDILVSSPFINHVFNEYFEKIKLGASAESWAMMLGFPLTISFAYILLIIIGGVFIKLKNDLNFLMLIAIISILLFVTGGLSNLQAAFFAILDSESPMRAWSRVSILIGSIGLILIFSALKYFKRWNDSLLLFFTFLLMLDLIFTPRLFNAESNWNENEYFSSVSYIKNNLNPCPVLQIPVDTFLVPQGALDKATRYYWTNFTPYIFLPDFKWTSGTYVGTNGWAYLANLPTTIDKSDFEQLSQKYCAIYFDKNFSEYQIARKAGLNFQEGNWPGIKILNTIRPDFEDSRFAIYLLHANK